MELDEIEKLKGGELSHNEKDSTIIYTFFQGEIFSSEIQKFLRDHLP